MSNYMLIPLGGKHGKGKFAKVSPEDYDEVIPHNWCLSHGYPVSRMGGGPIVYLHTLVAERAGLGLVDHENRNRLDAQRGNLRSCTQQQNSYNTPKFRRKGSSTSSYKGVSWDGARQKWCVRVTKDGEHFRLGGFATEEEAARAYDSVASFLFGEFAATNFEGATPISPESFRRQTGVAQFSSKFRGVHWHQKAKKWVGAIYLGNRRHHLGVFTSELAAARAYNEAAVRLKGEKAKLNAV